MRLSQITDLSASDIDIKGITADSRNVRPGYVYAALPGSRANGVDFIKDAIDQGAKVIVAGKDADMPEKEGVIFIRTDNARTEISRMAARFYKDQPETIVAVTGTSGKTSTAAFVQQLWELSGIEKAASLGTLGLYGGGFMRKGNLTTPDTVTLHAELADLAAAGVTHLAMEASSHGLDQYRLDGVRISAAAYTNLSRDHLDYHADMDAYFGAKARLFTELLPDGGTAIVNADDEYAPRLIDLCKARSLRVLTYGAAAREIVLKSHAFGGNGQHAVLEIFGKAFEVTIPLAGKFQIMNALCALGLVLSTGAAADKMVPLLSRLRNVSGRLEQVPGHPNGASVYVDYAHKPGALEEVLNTLRLQTKGRLVCLFGCGGDRDAGKRAIMGQIAAKLSDLVIVTDDNPRSENPATIRLAIMQSAPSAREIAGRGAAIDWAIKELSGDDVLVIAGKGHEKGQIIGDRTEPFDDVECAKNSMKNVKGKM